MGQQSDVFEDMQVDINIKENRGDEEVGIQIQLTPRQLALSISKRGIGGG